ncbi:DciA family protein [soil metagenome]
MSKSGVRTPAPKPIEKPRGGRARAVSELLPDVGRAAFRKFGFIQGAVVSRWAEIVGPKYAGVSAPESIRFPHGERANGVLTLLVGGAHAPMMQHIAPEIAERVNRFFGYTAVARVAIRQGDVAPPRPRAAPPSFKPIPAELGDSLRTIADPELKAVLEGLAASIGSPPALPKINGR